MDIVERIKRELKDLQELYKTGKRIEDVFISRIYPVIREDEMKTIEKRLGFRLPKLLRRLYLEISNGGYGPAYGLLSFGDGAKNELGQDIIQIYEEFREYDPEEPLWKWPEKLLPVCKLGCGMYTCIDCSTVEGVAILFEPNPRSYNEPLDDYLIPEASSTEEWLLGWLNRTDEIGFDNIPF